MINPAKEVVKRYRGTSSKKIGLCRNNGVPKFKIFPDESTIIWYTVKLFFDLIINLTEEICQKQSFFRLTMED
jgi:hypothetical protein